MALKKFIYETQKKPCNDESIRAIYIFVVRGSGLCVGAVG